MWLKAHSKIWDNFLTTESPLEMIKNEQIEQNGIGNSCDFILIDHH